MSEENQKVALVTGSNKGIGFEITRQLGFKGYKIFMCGRDKGRLTQAAGLLRGEGHNIESIILDVNEQGSIADLVKKLKDQDEKLDALVNNAAVMSDDSVSILEIGHDAIMNTINTNSIAPLILTRALLPFMKNGAKVVMMSSGAGAVCGEISSWAPIYSLSKTALNSVTRQLALELKKQDMAVNAVNPGWVKTDMGGSNANRSVSKGAETPVWLITDADPGETGKFWRDKQEIPW